MKQLIILLLIIFSIKAYSQYNGKNFSIGLNLVYTTDARIFPYPYSSSLLERNDEFDLSDILSPGLNFRYKLLEEVLVDLNIEYIKANSSGAVEKVYLGTGVSNINVTDGFKLVPVELSLFYLIPFSTERFKFLMGGGIGYYYGSMIRKFGDAEVTTIKRKTAYGIQVAVDLDYLIKDFLSIKAEIKFRDPQFTVTNKYDKQMYTYKGELVRITREEFDTKINVYGVNFIAGFVFHF